MDTALSHDGGGGLARAGVAVLHRARAFPALVGWRRLACSKDAGRRRDGHGEGGAAGRPTDRVRCTVVAVPLSRYGRHLAVYLRPVYHPRRDLCESVRRCHLPSVSADLLLRHPLLLSSLLLSGSGTVSLILFFLAIFFPRTISALCVYVLLGASPVTRSPLSIVYPKRRSFVYKT